MKCEICGQGPMHGTSIYRTAPKGQAPHWRCQFHMTTEQRDSVPNDVAVLAAIIERENDRAAIQANQGDTA